MLDRLDRIRQSPVGRLVVHVAQLALIGQAVVLVDKRLRNYHAASTVQPIEVAAGVDAAEPVFAPGWQDRLADHGAPDPAEVIAAMADPEPAHDVQLEEPGGQG